MNLIGNTLQEAVSQRSRTTIPEPVTSRRDATPLSLNHHMSKRQQTPTQSPEEGHGSFVLPLEAQAVKPPVRNQHKYPFYARILDYRIVTMRCNLR